MRIIRIQTLVEDIAKAESAEREAEELATQAAETLAKLLKDRTVEAIAAESAKLERKRAVLVELRAAMEKRDNAAAEAARLADEEASLVAEIEGAAQEKAATLTEAEAEAALLESARADLEREERVAGMSDQGAPLEAGQPYPSPEATERPVSDSEVIPSAAVEEARRNLSAAKIASDTAAREARVAGDVLTRIEERLAGVRKRRGEIRWQQTADHEAFEKVARSVRIFTPETLQEAFADLEKDRAAHETLVREIREAESAHQRAEETLLAQKAALAHLRKKLEG